MRCHRCGGPFPEDRNYCPACGAFRPVTRRPMRSLARPGWWAPMAFLIGSMVTIALLVAGFYAVFGSCFGDRHAEGLALVRGGES